MKEEKIKPYKPLPQRSKFRKANTSGQVPFQCVYFNFCGKHCRRFIDDDINKLIEVDCIVLQNLFCKNYKAGL